jgi:hypothetical protein
VTVAAGRAPEPRDTGSGVGGRGGGGVRAGTFLGPLLADLVAPLAAYYLVQAGGVGALAATMLAGLSTLPRQLVQFARRRRLDGLGIAVLAACVLGALLTLCTGDERLMAVKDAIWPLAAGLVTAGSCVRGKPVSFYVFRPLLTQGRAENRPLWDELWTGGPAFRRALRTLAALWATILLMAGAAEVVLSLRLPMNQAAAVPTLAQLVGVPLLLGCTALYGKRTGLGIRASLAAIRTEGPDGAR